MSDNLAELSMEQQFQVQAFQMQVKALSREQAQEMAVEIYKAMLVRDVLYQQMIGQKLIGDFGGKGCPDHL